MNAVNPVQSSAVSGAGGAEPSMEEILASIRRIIADDGAPPRLNDGRGHDRETDEGDLHPPHVPPEGGEAFEPLLQDTASNVLPADATSIVDRREEAPSPPGHRASSIASEETMAESAANFSQHPLHPDMAALGAIVSDEPVLRGSKPHDDGPPHASAAAEARHAGDEPLLAAAADSSVTAAFNTLAASRFVDNSEQLSSLVREMIRPLVKSWIDENLPGMVERLVVAEIERMGRGRRS